MGFLAFLKHQSDRAAAWGLIAVGGLLLIVGYFRVSSTPYLAEQIPFIVSAGLVGLVVVGVGGILLVSADLRDEWRKLDDLEKAVTALADRVGPSGASATGRAPTRRRDGTGAA